MPTLIPGSDAPDLTLTSIEGAPVRLADAWSSGPAVLVFYRGDFCPVCNRYLHALQTRHDELANAGITLLAISSDRPERGAETVRRNELPFAVLSDPDRRAIDAYGVIYNEAEGHAEPAVFVVDGDGRIAFEAIVSGPLGRPPVDEVVMIARRVAAGPRERAGAYAHPRAGGSNRVCVSG